MRSINIVGVASLFMIAACGSDSSVDAVSADDATKPSSVAENSETFSNNISDETDAETVSNQLLGKTWKDPKADQLAMLYYQLKGDLPPVDAMVENTLSGNMSVNGLNRAEKVATVKNKIMSEYEDAEGVDTLEFELRTHLDDYDPTYQEYRIALFRPGATQIFRDNGWQVGVRFVNAAEGGLWKATPEEARDIALATSNGMNQNKILVKVKASVVGAVSPRNRGRSHVGDIKARILSYSVHTRDGLQELAQASFN